MTELSPQMLRLLEVVRSADGPSARDRERLRARLAPMLAAGSVLATTAGAAACIAPAATAAESVTTATAAASTTATGVAAGTTAATGLSASLAAATPTVVAKLSIGQLLVWTALGVGVGTAGVATTVATAPPAWQESTASIVSSASASYDRAQNRRAPQRTPSRETAPETVDHTDRSPSVADAPTQVHSSGANAAVPVATGAARRLTATPARRSASDSLVAGEGLDRGQAHTEAEATNDPAAGTSAQALGGSTLADETSLLRAAQTAQRRGDDALALELLRTHARRYPGGLLKVERGVAEVLSLCAQGQGEASNRLRARLLRESPHIPAVARIREPCVTTPK